MYLIPAIDLLDGRCVRLLHGDFNERTFYDFDPLALARSYLDSGADWLHVVDLAASRDGPAADTAPLMALLRAAPQQLQTGGGVRSRGDVAARLGAGANRVVIGSLCANEPERFSRWLGEFGANTLVAALDVHVDENGIAWPQTHGWTESADRDLHDLLDQLVADGLRHLLCTDISRDGAMSGPNDKLYRDLVNRYPDLEIQASGGVSRLQDLWRLKDTGVAAAITGKAVLEGVFTVAEAVEALS